MAIMLSTIPRTRWTLAAPEGQKTASQSADAARDKSGSGATLSKTGRLLLTEHFVRQLRKKLYDQKDVLALVDHSQSWVLEVMYRESVPLWITCESACGARDRSSGSIRSSSRRTGSAPRPCWRAQRCSPAVSSRAHTPSSTRTT